MAHINSIGASVYTQLHYVELSLMTTVTAFGVGGLNRDTASSWQGLFANTEAPYTGYTAGATGTISTGGTLTSPYASAAAQSSVFTFGS